MLKLADMILTVKEAASELGVSEQCVRDNYLKNGQLVGIKKQDTWIIPRDELERFKKIPRPHGVNVRYRHRRRKRA